MSDTMGEMIPRKEWSLLRWRMDGYKRQATGHNTEGWVVHWPGPAYPSSGTPLQEIQSYERYHVEHKGWSGLAYNFAVDPEGQVYEGRGWNYHNIANEGSFQRKTYSILFLGTGLRRNNKGERPVTDKAIAAAAALMAQEPGNGKVRPHKAVSSSGTACPGRTLQASIPRIVEAMKGNTPMPDPVPAPDTDYGKSVTRLYEKVLGHGPDEVGLSFWVGKLERKEATFVDVLVEFLAVRFGVLEAQLSAVAAKADAAPGSMKPLDALVREATADFLRELTELAAQDV